MVKSIKNKIVGSGHGNVKTGKENMNTSSKKFTTVEYSGLNTEEKVTTPRTPSQKIGKSFHNFSMIKKV